jgi:pimeloyl-ACP methyl ester carboxylesterase
MSSTASDQPKAETIVLIHGMWMTPLSWEHWASHYTDRGFRVLAPAWPGLDKEPEELRRDPAPLRGIDITDVVDHYDKIIRGLDRPPIIIGHSLDYMLNWAIEHARAGAETAEEAPERAASPT